MQTVTYSYNTFYEMFFLFIASEKYPISLSSFGITTDSYEYSKELCK